MKSRRIPLESEVDKYEVGKGMEDGFELFSDVVTKGWIVTDSLVKIERPDGTIVSRTSSTAEDVPLSVRAIILSFNRTARRMYAARTKCGHAMRSRRLKSKKKLQSVCQHAIIYR